MTGSRFFACRKRTAATVALSVFCVCPNTTHADWLHYRGPTMNGITAEKLSLLATAGAPRVLWKTNVGLGSSSVTVQGDRAYTMGNIDRKDYVYCLDVKTGKEIWKMGYPLDTDPNQFEGGPRSTPTVDGDLVFAVSHQGDLWALDAATGKKVWYKHYQQDFGGRRPSWGYAGSPTVDGNLLLLDVGGRNASTIALNKKTGDVVWKSGSDEAAYASVVVAMIDGVRTAIAFKASGPVGYDVSNGKELWRSTWTTDVNINAATPVIFGNRIFITSGYNAGATLIEVNNGHASERWRNKNLRMHINSPVVRDGHAYGIDGQAGGGNLVCLDLSTGDRRWEEKTVKGGSLILAGDKLIVLSEKGELVICDASPNGFHALSRNPVLSQHTWVQPVLVKGRLFVKGNEGELVALDFGVQ